MGVQVTVSEGKLEGKVCADYRGRSFYSFQAIPYAKPPLGELRFKPPQPPEQWQGVRDATREGPECYSRNIITNMIGGSEDCLFLNVYTPQVEGKEHLPVMFWIHGGGFVTGSGGTELHGPDYLVEKNVVLVTVNYRLGPLGFLAFSDPSVGVTGNAGLKDVVMALKWVQKNIRQFSGDPKNVTVFGESAGAAAVHFLVLSPMAKGLFHKAIMQSGCALNCFARGRRSAAQELAYKLGINSNNDKFVLAELQKVPVNELVKISTKIWDPFSVSHTRPFCPVVEPETREPGFLTEEPLDIIKSGTYNRVPMLMGYNGLEGIFICFLMNNKDKHFLTDASLVPHTMNLRIGSPQYKRVAEEIKGFYGIRGDESMKNEADFNKGLKVYTHNSFMIDICRSALLHRENNKFPIYFYRFDLDTELNFMKTLSGVQNKGASHADDLAYLFNTIFIPPPDGHSIEFKLIQKVSKLWASFAKRGNPTPLVDDKVEVKWRPVTLTNFDYLSMENEGFKMLSNPDKEFVDFWINLYRENQMLLSKL